MAARGEPQPQVRPVDQAEMSRRWYAERLRVTGRERLAELWLGPGRALTTYRPFAKMEKEQTPSTREAEQVVCKTMTGIIMS